MPEVLLERDDQVLALLNDVADELDKSPSGPICTLVIVGGAYMLLHHLRGSTRDVDTVSRLGAELEDAAQIVAARHDLAPRWLNSDAKPFVPADFSEAQCRVVLERARLVVLYPPSDVIFLMKMQAARGIDQADMVALWPHCSFQSADTAVEMARPSRPALARLLRPQAAARADA